MFCSRCGTEVADQSKFCPSCGLDLTTATPLASQEGTSGEISEIDMVREALGNEYEIQKELGRGGMAIVFQAREKHLDREVAVKVLPFSLAFDKEFVERFQREARTAAKLEHPYIIPIYRVGKEKRVIYFVMKYLRGSSLSEILQRRRSLPPEEIRSFLQQTAGALGYAHQHGIVHRDIKPDNIMFDEMGHAILTDFGIAKAATGTRLTGTGMSIGTPHYMSPEQARAQSLDGRSDIYSLGVVAYQCLVGQVPYDGEDAFSIGYKHIMEELPSPPLHTQDQRQLFEMIQRMMAKDPNERFQTAQQLVAAIEGRPTAQVTAAPGSTVSDLPTTIMPSPARGSTAIPPGALPTTPTTPIPANDTQASRREVAKKEKKRSPVLVGMFLFLLLGGGGAGGYWYFALDAQWPLDVDTILGRTPVDTTSIVTPPPLDTMPPVDTTAVPEPTTGWLSLVDRPVQAQVAIDGTPADTANLVELSPGEHVITAQRRGYRDFSTTVQVGLADTVPVPSNTLRVGLGDTVPVTIAMEWIPQPQCTNPQAARYNMNDFCFDTPASVTPACLIPTPTEDKPTAQLWVNVRDDGTMADFRFRGDRPANNRFVIGLTRFVRNEAVFTPATKGGQLVESWMRLVCRAR